MRHDDRNHDAAGHDHDHDKGSHPHGHAHAPADFGRAFAIGIALNLSYVFAQVVFGVLANSVALLADAAHNLSDVLGLVLAWGASVLVKRLPTRRFTYGLRKTSVLAALANAGRIFRFFNYFMHPPVRQGYLKASLSDGSLVSLRLLDDKVNFCIS